jgi:hypothetical protein
VAAEAGREPEAQAGWIDGAVALKIGVVVETMVSLAEGDAWQAAGDGTWKMISVSDFLAIKIHG